MPARSKRPRRKRVKKHTRGGVKVKSYCRRPPRPKWQRQPDLPF